MSHYIDVHTHHCSKADDVVRVLNLHACNWETERMESACFSVGLHPWDVREPDLPATLECINEASDCPTCVAVGEIGCDKACAVPLHLQLRALHVQLLMANSKQLPIILHNVHSLQELLGAVKQAKLEVPFIVHGFRGHAQMALQVLRAGGKLSFGKALLRHPATMEAFKTLTPQDVFFETDDEPSLSIATVYQQAALLSNKSVEEWTEIQKDNFNRTFRCKID